MNAEQEAQVRAAVERGQTITVHPDANTQVVIKTTDADMAVEICDAVSPVQDESSSNPALFLGEALANVQHDSTFFLLREIDNATVDAFMKSMHLKNNDWLWTYQDYLESQGLEVWWVQNALKDMVRPND